MEFKYFEIEFEDGEYAYIEEENLEKLGVHDASSRYIANYDYEEVFQKVINIRDGRIVNDTLER